MAEHMTAEPGVADPGVAEPGSPAVANITWDEDNVNLQTLDNGSGLPQVVKFEERSTGAVLESPSSLPTGLKIYAGQPVLLSSRANKKFAKARTIYHDREGPYYEVGQTLMVPEDFHGWFELVPGDFGRAPLCRTICEIADIMPQKFFTRTRLRAIRIETETDETDKSSQTEDGKQLYKERKVKAGTVLKVLGTFAAKWQTTASTGMFKRKSKEWTTVEMTYLKCQDVDESEILIPISTRGKFSIIYEKGSRDARAVYTMKDILSANFQFPIKVRMVFGKAPVVPCIFTGMLILKEKSNSDCFVASTILNKRNVLFELPVNTKCDVKKATNEEDYENLRTFIDAQLLCKKYGRSYSALIKLSPDLDTNQQTLQHIPTERRKKRGESLKNLDLITDISVTDDEPRDFFMEDSSDSDSLQSADMAPLAVGEMMELREINLPRTSQSISSA